MTRRKKRSKPTRYTATLLRVREGVAMTNNPFAVGDEDETGDTPPDALEQEVPPGEVVMEPPPPDVYLTLAEDEQLLTQIIYQLDKICYSLYKNGLEYELGRCDVAYNGITGTHQALQFVLQNQAQEPVPDEASTG